MRNLVLFMMLGTMCVAHAVVVPNYAAGLEADGTFSLTSTAAAGRTYQMTIAANQLTGLSGQVLTGFRLRLNGAATAAWPGVDTSYAAFDVYIGPGVAPASMSNTFALNFTGTPTQVRAGSLVVPAGAFTSGSSPNAFGPAITFDSGYPYSGGDLAIELRFSGQVGATNQPSFDGALASGGPGNGWGVDFGARWTGNIAGTSGTNGNFLVTEFVVGGVGPTISGAVDLQDWTASLDGQMVKFEITAAGGGPVLQTTDAMLDGMGAYSFATALPAGTYDIYAKGSHWLRKARFGAVLTGSGGSGLDYSLFNGDCDDDNEVGIGDFAVLSAAFGSDPSAPNWDPMADLDGDEEVSIGDYAILSGNFGMIGD